MKKGFFITFEGPEGSGKSSQAKRLAAALRRQGHRVVLVSDPGSTALGRQLRHVLLHARLNVQSPFTEAFLFLASRLQLVAERIRPALREGTIVICDRFHDSTVVYQGYGGGLDVNALDHLGREVIKPYMPNLTMLLDVSTEQGFARLGHARDRMERKQRIFHHRVRAGYLLQATHEPKRFVIVDAAQSPNAVHRTIWAAVQRRLPTRGRR